MDASSNRHCNVLYFTRRASRVGDTSCDVVPAAFMVPELDESTSTILARLKMPRFAANESSPSQKELSE